MTQKLLSDKFEISLSAFTFDFAYAVTGKSSDSSFTILSLTPYDEHEDEKTNFSPPTFFANFASFIVEK